MAEMYAVVRIRGGVNISPKIRDTLKMLNLSAVNRCVIIPKTPGYEGMLIRAKSHLTWGEIDQKMIERLVLKRGRMGGDRRPDAKTAKEITREIISKKSLKNTGIKPVFRLSPPRGGLKSIRLPYPRGDAGFRGKDINKLLERMI